MTRSANARTARFLSAAALAASLIATASACDLGSDGGVNTSADHTTHSAASAATAGSSAHKTGSQKAKVGDSITLASEIDNDKVTVKLIKIVTSGVHATDGFSTPDNGKRYVAVQFRLTNSGTNAFSDDPYLDVQILDDAGQSFQPEIMMTDSTAGHGFASTVNIAPGDSQLGFIIVQMPTKDEPADVQFSLDGGLGATAQWQAS
ncbi:DUF4352 domain-containing protein [Actinospica robiniae]|uniref:DUF4352 domain-containing protein n=1 Tax=Actinospica robiniae TaxID=304901 RepID=UPI000429EE2D|nr:DUF4352 domain-containing protein [Actinospica robiniae]